MADLEKFPTMERDFSDVILTLENVLVPQEKLSPTPSMLDGLGLDTETDLRILGCELIQTSGILLKLPQVAMAAGQVLFQRFYYSKSFIKHNMEIVAMACINLASKIEEAPRRIRDVINVFHHVKQIKNGKTIQPLILDQNYINLKNQVIKSERRVLKELGFCVHVKHPHKIIVMYLQVLESEQNKRLVQCAWNYMNDSFRTSAFVQYSPETIACACIYLAARNLQIPMPSNPPWYGIFGVDEVDIKEICVLLLKLYARKKPNPEHLETIVNDAKKIQIEAKLKAKGLQSANVTPDSSSRPSSPKGASPAPISNLHMKKLKKEEGFSDHCNDSKENHVSRKRDRSNSRTPRAYSKNRSYSSKSRSRSPVKRKHSKYSPSRKFKKDNHRSRSGSKDRSRDHYSSKEKRKRKHRSRSVTRSRSRSLDASPVRGRAKKNYKNKKDLYARSRSRSFERHKPKKSNGHRHRSRSRDRYRR